MTCADMCPAWIGRWRGIKPDRTVAGMQEPRHLCGSEKSACAGYQYIAHATLSYDLGAPQQPNCSVAETCLAPCLLSRLAGSGGDVATIAARLRNDSTGFSTTRICLRAGRGHNKMIAQCIIISLMVKPDF